MSGFTGTNPNILDNYNGCNIGSTGCNDKRFFNSAFNSEFISYDFGGGTDCALIHQQFVINLVRTNVTAQDVAETIYRAAGFARCQNPGDSIFPFGTIVVRNLSIFPVTVVITGEGPSQSIIVQPNSEGVIISNSIGEVNAIVPVGQTARVSFLFDIFFPANPFI
jgi:hypothetical protein